ncbi:MAG: hypothetical protein MZV70_59240 [Desulfobacterales bacterium]|nr:hypothetical protein [Desulfobacterales bacterium]
MALPPLPAPDQHLRAAHRLRGPSPRGGPSASADYFVLTVPLSHGQACSALFVFHRRGSRQPRAWSSSRPCALSTMVMNSIIMPALDPFSRAQGSGFPPLILNIKRHRHPRHGLSRLSLRRLDRRVLQPRRHRAQVLRGGHPLRPGLLSRASTGRAGTEAGAIAGIVAGLRRLVLHPDLPGTHEGGPHRDDGLSWRTLTTFELLNPNSLFGVEGPW